MQGADEHRRVAAAIALLTIFADPRKAPPRRRKRVSVPAEVFAAMNAFWASRENYDSWALEKHPKVALDATLEIGIPKSDAVLECPGFTLYPLAQYGLVDVAPELGSPQSRRMGWRKLVSLNATRVGPGWFERSLMIVRRLAATKRSRRRRLVNTQEGEFYRDYVLPYGLLVGRYYFAWKTLGEVHRALRKLPLLTTISLLVRAVTRRIGVRP
jgi:hypothetical protein